MNVQKMVTTACVLLAVLLIGYAAGTFRKPQQTGRATGEFTVSATSTGFYRYDKLTGKTWVLLWGSDRSKGWVEIPDEGKSYADDVADASHPPIILTSTAFESGKPIPKECTGDGEGSSPPLAWSRVPQGTKELVLICDEDYSVHWLLYKIPANVTSLSGALPRKTVLRVPLGAVQGTTTFRDIGYHAPAPRPGSYLNQCRFTLYALDAPVSYGSSVDEARILNEIRGHVLAYGELVGTY